MSRNYQQSSVLPLLSWPNYVVSSKDPNPAVDVTTIGGQEGRHVPIDSSVKSSREWIQHADDMKEEATELIASRSPSFQVWNDRRVTRLLEEHWHAVTMALKKLQAEVAKLQAQLDGTEKNEFLSSNSVKNLAIQQASLVQEFRNRVGRCDASIAVISNDIRRLAEDLSSVNKQIVILTNSVEKVSKEADQKVVRLQSDIQEQSHQQSLTKNKSENRLEESVNTLEFKTKSQLKELHSSVQSLQSEYEARQRTLVQEIAQSMEKLQGQSQQKQNHFEKEVTDRLQSLEHSSKKLEAEHERLCGMIEEQDKHLKDHVTKQMAQMEENVMNVLRVQVEDIKSSMQSGFGTTQSNLETMRRVLEGKQRLSEESLRKDMARMKKLVVLT